VFGYTAPRVAGLSGGRPFGIITPQEYGAKADGVTDDSAAIQTAANAAAGGALHFPVGTYLCANIDLPSDIEVTAHPRARLLAPAGLAAASFFFKVAGTATTRKNRVRVRGFRQADANSSAAGLANFTFVDGAEVEDCSVTGLPTDALNHAYLAYFADCDNPQAVNCASTGGYYGVSFTRCINPKVTRGNYRNVQRDGVIFLDSSGQATADRVRVDGYALAGEGGRAGIHFYGGHEGVAIGNTIRNAGATATNDTGGIRFRDYGDFTAVGNVIVAPPVGILVNKVGDFAVTVAGTIAGNFVRSPRFHGINVGAGDVTVTGNRVRDVTDVAYTGIFMAAAARGSISGNTVSDCADVGISVGASNVSVEGNTTLRCGRGGFSTPHIGISGTNCSVVGNAMSDDRTTAVGTLAIRIFSGGSAIVGENAFGTGITDFVTVSGTYLRQSVPWRNKFANTPTAGTFEVGCLTLDSGGALFRCITGGAPGTWKRLDPKNLSATIGTVSTTVAHGLGYTPTQLWATPQANAVVWRSALSDATNVYLAASVSVACDIYVA
jgi:parallel beta-helix repeat protein